jgi:hypothetical protein
MSVIGCSQHLLRGATPNAKTMNKLARSLIIIVGISPCLLQAQDHRCNVIEAQQAEVQAHTLRSWDALFNSYKSYSQCDDGARQQSDGGEKFLICSLWGVAVAPDGRRANVTVGVAITPPLNSFRLALPTNVPHTTARIGPLLVAWLL